MGASYREQDMYDCVFYNIWFGEMPNYFQYHALACERNSKSFHWIVYTDQVEKKTSWNSAITAYPYSWEELSNDFRKIGVKINRPATFTRAVTKTIAQCRLFLPIVRNDPTPESTHWGISEFDVIYGDLRKYFYDLEDWLVISGDPRAGCGPLSVFRNDCQEMLMNYPNIIHELEDNSYDTIETNEFLLFFEDRGNVKRFTGLQPFREKFGFTAGHWAKWRDGVITVFGSQGKFEAGMFHFGGQRKSGKFKVTLPPSRFWKVSDDGIFPLGKPLKFL